MSTRSIASAEWLKDASLQRLIAILSEGGEEARIAGGAVRDALLDRPVTDIDLATTCLPAEVVRRAEAAGFRTIPTGIAHGTVTVLVAGRAIEVTTLRQDVETDGRHATVVFGRDWKRDAERRDFPINALYAEADGTVIDIVGGLDDLDRKFVRFIGDADQRIREDFLRILRFFRFFAWYGEGRPDAEGLKACARQKAGLTRLSAERVWHELKRLLAAPDPSRALLWMRQAGVLTAILPESEKWGIDAIHGLVTTERDLGWGGDPLLRLMAIVPPDAERMAGLAERLRLSKVEAGRLSGWAASATPKPETPETELAKLLYQDDPAGIRDRLRLAQAASRTKAAMDDAAMIEAGGFSRLLKQLESWTRPVFPLAGVDLLALGYEPGEILGAALRTLEDEWVRSGFRDGRAALLARAPSLRAGPLKD